ncbi:ROK family protein [uncultured Methanoregula sp.]|uniref:ROK family protein n=1 Tax=uncultured Methanoregula sp. TaxID=1005933 RepID=UPI002AAC16ED|nr:ROK family protein [uncultured Methanoregula sp.]
MTIGDRTGTSGTAIAVDLGATNLRVGLVTRAGTIERLQTAEIPHDLPDEGIITGLIIRTIQTLVPDREIGALAGIGIGAAGPVNRSHTAIVHPPNIALDIIPLSGPLGDEFGLPVRLVNDCCAGLLGEAYFGEGARSRNFVYVTISTGIGAGIIANGNIVSGRDGNAGEIGHLFVDSGYNLTCGCGGKGHWEGYASGRFLPRFYREWQKKRGIVPGDREILTAGEVFSAMLENPGSGEDDFACELGRINARGISDIIVAYNPDTIVFDGSVVLKNRDLIIPPIERYADRYLPMPRLVVSGLAGRAPLLGASVIAHGYDTRFGSVE